MSLPGTASVSFPALKLYLIAGFSRFSRGVNIFGGSGSMIGALLGVLMIEILQQSLLRWAGISEFVKDAILGLLILIAVTADTVILGRLREMWVRVRRRDRAAAQAARAEESGLAHGA